MAVFTRALRNILEHFSIDYPLVTLVAVLVLPLFIFTLLHCMLWIFDKDFDSADKDYARVNSSKKNVKVNATLFLAITKSISPKESAMH